MIRTYARIIRTSKVSPVDSAIFVLSVLFVLSNQAAFANDAVQAKTDYITARQAEVNGQIDGARYGYSHVLSYGMASRHPGQSLAGVTVCGESLGSIGRRAIALQVNLLRKEKAHPSGKYVIPSLEGELRHLYMNMQAVEPQNPNWYYLEALIVCEKEHHYVKARRLLNKCIRCPGGSPAVKAKAKKLLAHIKSTADQQQIWLAQDVKVAKQNFKRYIDSGAFARGSSMSYSHGRSDDSSKSDSMPSWEREARNAEARGDYGAADRLRGGGASCSDSAIYNY